jgi:hypothetical protein
MYGIRCFWNQVWCRQSHNKKRCRHTVFVISCLLEDLLNTSPLGSRSIWQLICVGGVVGYITWLIPANLCYVAFPHCMPHACLRAHRRTTAERFYEVSVTVHQIGEMVLYKKNVVLLLKYWWDVRLFYDAISTAMFRRIKCYRVIMNNE